VREDRLPADIRSFLRDHIRSLEQLEILILLQRNGERWWSAAKVAEELRTSAASTASRLEEMASRNLLDVRIAEQLVYRYAPVSPALEAAARETVRLYKEKPVTVTAAIYSQAVDEIRAFADAFRIRGKEGGGG
jgi:hypothetical protein